MESEEYFWRSKGEAREARCLSDLVVHDSFVGRFEHGCLLRDAPPGHFPKPLSRDLPNLGSSVCLFRLQPNAVRQQSYRSPPLRYWSATQKSASRPAILRPSKPTPHSRPRPLFPDFFSFFFRHQEVGVDAPRDASPTPRGVFVGGTLGAARARGSTCMYSWRHGTRSLLPSVHQQTREYIRKYEGCDTLLSVG